MAAEAPAREPKAAHHPSDAEQEDFEWILLKFEDGAPQEIFLFT
jgi:hypothetical protein